MIRKYLGLLFRNEVTRQMKKVFSAEFSAFHLALYSGSAAESRENVSEEREPFDPSIVNSN